MQCSEGKIELSKNPRGHDSRPSPGTQASVLVMGTTEWSPQALPGCWAVWYFILKTLQLKAVRGVFSISHDQRKGKTSPLSFTTSFQGMVSRVLCMLALPWTL